jgi:hypothetical protein
MSHSIDDDGRDLTTQLKISIGAAFFATFLVLFYLVSRRGFELAPAEYLNVLGVAFFILFLPNNLSKAAALLKRARWIALTNECLMTLLAVGFIVLSGLMSRPPYGPNLLFVVLGYVFFFTSLVAYARLVKRIHLIYLIGILIFAIAAASRCWEGRHLSPLFFELLSVGDYSTEDMGNGLDPLFHMSIAQSLKTYDVSSLGIDQLTPYKYHFGSHFVLAQFSKVLGLSVLKTYHLAYPVIFFSIFLKVFFSLVFQVREFFGIQFKAPVFFWLTFVYGFFGVLTINFYKFVQTRVALRLDVIWVSESYQFSLILFFSAISIALSNCRRGNLPSFNRNTWISILLVSGLIIISGFVKVSTMAVLLAMACYLILRCRLYTDYKFILLFLATMVLSYLVFLQVTNTQANPVKLEFFHSYKNYIHASVFSFITIYYFLLLAISTVYVLKYQLFKKANLAEAVRTKSLLFLELLWLVAVVGIAPGLFLNIESGNAFYFSEIQHWFALCFILAFLPEIVDQFKSTRYPRVFQQRFIKVFNVLCVSFISVTLIFNVSFRFLFFVQNNLYARRLIINYPKPIKRKTDEGGRIKSLLTLNLSKINDAWEIFSTPVQDKLDTLQRYSILRRVSQLDTLSGKSETVIFITDYSGFSEYFPCYKYPFLIPTLTGMATLEGFDQKNCSWVIEYIPNYGFEDYKPTDRIFFGDPDEGLCQKINDRTFKKILVLHNLYNGEYSVVHCLEPNHR